MSAGIEDEVIAEWLVATLTNDPVMQAEGIQGVYADKVSYGASFPAIVFQMQDGTDVLPVGSGTFGIDSQWIVKIIVPGDDVTVISGARKRLYELLDSTYGVTPEGEVFECYRTAPYRMNEESTGKTYLHRGGFYTISAA